MSLPSARDWVPEPECSCSATSLELLSDARESTPAPAQWAVAVNSRQANPGASYLKFVQPGFYLRGGSGSSPTWHAGSFLAKVLHLRIAQCQSLAGHGAPSEVRRHSNLGPPEAVPRLSRSSGVQTVSDSKNRSPRQRDRTLRGCWLAPTGYPYGVSSTRSGSGRNAATTCGPSLSGRVASGASQNLPDRYQ